MDCVADVSSMARLMARLYSSAQTASRMFDHSILGDLRTVVKAERVGGGIGVVAAVFDDDAAATTHSKKVWV